MLEASNKSASFIDKSAYTALSNASPDTGPFFQHSQVYFTVLL
jgi:hypothetical protein